MWPKILEIHKIQPFFGDFLKAAPTEIYFSSLLSENPIVNPFTPLRGDMPGLKGWFVYADTLA